MQNNMYTKKPTRKKYLPFTSYNIVLCKLFLSDQVMTFLLHISKVLKLNNIYNLK